GSPEFGSQNTANTGISNSNLNTTTTRKNIQSRNWYLSDSQWAAFKDDEITSTKHKNDYTDPHANKNIDKSALNIHADENDEGSVDNTLGSDRSNELEIRGKYVVVPETSQDMAFK
uniref:Protein PCF11 n=1 Tax=Saccharomyces cerevisiae (strain ATCC 204508 / S288c) TaxID=559292 RepID=UPI00045BAB2E|nr:Chain B, Protein PCF11 [Saccharomyces cerevisiae S288C]4OI4_D Chain D, Protein PCF11 [Saccharomyces cerevisiae S288C]4OI4_U Chain U, Protein PCF11 [Saccharomyces cerevisiae S288C]